mgnify:CR=1 FL=1
MANESIIKAAGQAYTPNPGQYDLSGFIQGIAAVAGGIVKRQQEVAKRGKQADEIYLSSDNTVVQGIVLNLQDQVRSGTMTQAKAKQKLADLDRAYNKDLPQIELMVKDIFKKGISKSADEITENYLLGLSLGELDSPIIINGEEFSSFYSVDPVTNSLTVLSPTGEFVSPRELRAIMSNTPTIELRDGGNKVTNTFLKGTFKDGEIDKYNSAKDDFINGMKSEFLNKQKKLSWLLDNPQGYEITNNLGEVKKRNFLPFYLQNGLDEKQLETYKTELDNIRDKDVLDKTQLMFVKKLMEDDPNLDTDIELFLNKMAGDKMPREKTFETVTSTPTVSGFSIKGKLTKSESQDVSVINGVESLFDNSQAEIKKNKDIWKSGKSFQGLDGEVLLTPDPNKEGYFYFEKNMKGQTDENKEPIVGPRYSASFPLASISEEGYKRIMLEVLREVPGGLTYGSTVYNQYKLFLNKK